MRKLSLENLVGVFLSSLLAINIAGLSYAVGAIVFHVIIG
tara:strand:- start:1001 stop:1120 length:120 start_codon:yes stop_codon:yes gene_type:complete